MLSIAERLRKISDASSEKLFSEIFVKLFENLAKSALYDVYLVKNKSGEWKYSKDYSDSDERGDIIPHSDGMDCRRLIQLLRASGLCAYDVSEERDDIYVSWFPGDKDGTSSSDDDVKSSNKFIQSEYKTHDPEPSDTEEQSSKPTSVKPFVFTHSNVDHQDGWFVEFPLGDRSLIEMGRLLHNITQNEYSLFFERFTLVKKHMNLPNILTLLNESLKAQSSATNELFFEIISRECTDGIACVLKDFMRKHTIDDNVKSHVLSYISKPRRMTFEFTADRRFSTLVFV